jgi:septal ring factor EnvC (AmiA/AmiB activator)
VIEQLEDTLHQLDRDINELRRQIWMTKNGLTRSEDRSADVARLEEEFQRLGDRFVETYRAWSRQHAAE